MCPDEVQTKQPQLPTLPPPPPAACYSAGMKRPLAAALRDDGGNAAAERRRKRREIIRGKRARAVAGALVPYVAPPPPPIDPQPIRAVPHAAVEPTPPKTKRAAAEAAPPPVEPEWLRDLLVERLNLTRDQPLVFIGKRKVAWSDLKDHQNRFRLPTLGVQQRLLPMLTLDEAKAANLVENNEEGTPPKPRKRRRSEKEINVEGTAAPEPRKKGKEHGGMPVMVMHGKDVEGMRELRMVVWDSTNGTVIKGNGYTDFIKRTKLKEHDVVQIWAFKRREFRFFGATVTESPLFLLIVGDAPLVPFVAPPLGVLPPAPSHARVGV